MEESHINETVHFVQILSSFPGLVKGGLEELESLLTFGGLRGKHHTHVIVREERLRVDTDRCLVVLRSILVGTTALLDYSKVVVDSDLIAELAFNLVESINGLISSLQLF